MHVSRIIAAGVVTCVTLVSTANAQIADRRSFLHPLGIWSNDCYVAQREVYPQIQQPGIKTANFGFFAATDAMEPSQGGGVQHERNW